MVVSTSTMVVIVAVSGIITGAATTTVISIRWTIGVVIVTIWIIASATVPVGITWKIVVIVPIVVRCRGIPVVPAKANTDSKSKTEINV